jgi:iron complex transport system substrate-binding protein
MLEAVRSAFARKSPRADARRVVFASAAIVLCATLAACSSGSSNGAQGAAGAGSGSTTGATSFPLSIRAANGDIRIPARPIHIVSLSPSATETLYAIGAGSQVKAVDQFSDYPPGTPRTSLDGNQPNTEAIVSYHPDLVVTSGDPTGLTGQLAAFGIPVLSEPAATSLSNEYSEIDQLGEATGHTSQANAEVAHIQSQISSIVRRTPKPARPLTYYYELDQTYYSVTSATFIGKVLGLLGLKNIADAATGAASSGGYPQLSAEFIITANPDYVFLADTICCQQSAATVAARPGWSTLQAVRNGHVVPLNDDIASRWGPRIVDLLQTVANALSSKGSSPS